MAEAVSAEPTRGERNNNPGNIDYDPANSWLGLAGIEQVPDGHNYTPRFCRFDTMQNGVRAIAKTMLTYYREHGCDSVRKIINRWAPPTENNFGAYVADVAQSLHVHPDGVIDVTNPGTLQSLARSIIRHENGRCLIDDQTMSAAIQSALGISETSPAVDV